MKAALALNPGFTIRRFSQLTLRTTIRSSSLAKCELVKGYGWSVCQKGDFALGSIATETSFPCHVRFAPVSDQIADIA